MSDRHAGRTVLLIVGGLVVLSSLSGLAYGVMTQGDFEHQLAAEREQEDHERAAWCENVRAHLGAGKPVRSFRHLVEAALGGELASPAAPPPTTSVEALDRWQSEHAAFVTSSYLAALEGYPEETGFDGPVLKVVLADAHAGRVPGLDRSQARSVGRRLDAFVATRC